LQDAEDCKFDEVVYQCIKFYLDKVRHMLQQHKCGCSVHWMLYPLHVERELSKLLAPWFDFHLRATREGQIFIQLRSLLTQREFEESGLGTGLNLPSQPVWKIHEGNVLLALACFLDKMGVEILQGSWPSLETRNFIAPFRSYLTSGGNPDLMPVIKGGDMKTERRDSELTGLRFFREEASRRHLGCDCAMHRLFQDMEETLHSRMSADDLVRIAWRELLTAAFELDVPENLNI